MYEVLRWTSSLLRAVSLAAAPSSFLPGSLVSTEAAACYCLARMMGLQGSLQHPALAAHVVQPTVLPSNSLHLARGFKRSRISQRPRIMPISAAASDFYAQQATSFSSLGVHEGLAQALERVGLQRPSFIQVHLPDVPTP